MARASSIFKSMDDQEWVGLPNLDRLADEMYEQCFVRSTLLVFFGCIAELGLTIRCDLADDFFKAALYFIWIGDGIRTPFFRVIFAGRALSGGALGIYSG